MARARDTTPIVVALIVSALLSALGVAVPRAAGGPSPVVYPAQRLPLRFSHAQHLAGGATCESCHERARTSRSAVDLLTPGEAACRTCHAIDRARPDGTGGPATACVACHPGHDPARPMIVARVAIPPPNLKFSHAAHATTPCQTCHGDLARDGVGLATRDHLPRMDVCLTCHDGARAADGCTTCHLATAGGRVRTELPDGRLTPTGGVSGAVHDANFRTDHDQIARSDPRACASCHEERFCADCHLGAVKPMDFHAGDYVAVHAIEARRGTPDCSACHRAQTFCVGCHERSGVGVRAEPGFFRTGDSGRFHPRGWVGGGAGDGHAREAQQNLKQCASCHRDDFCRECHTAEPGRMGVSPHGPGWRGSARCQALARKNPRLCLRCHLDTRTCD